MYSKSPENFFISYRLKLTYQLSSKRNKKVILNYLKRYRRKALEHQFGYENKYNTVQQKKK